MPTIKKMLQLYDLDLINRIGGFWGVDTSNMDQASAINALSQGMEDVTLINEILESLPAAAKEAWMLLADNSQQITWSQFIRKYGEVREFGPARREREEPEMHPISTTEILWYRGLIGRAFMNLPPEPREFVYIPNELLKLITHSSKEKKTFEVKPVSETSLNRKSLANSRLIDHMTDWLAGRRMGRKLPDNAWKSWLLEETFITMLSSEVGLVDHKGDPEKDALPVFFQQERSEILGQWLAAWKNSTKINDLKILPGLVIEGNCKNDPVRTRNFLFEYLQELNPDTWYSLASFVHLIKNNAPDFQRPSGDYDSWYIRKSDSDTYLRGFEHWDEVDGSLIRYLICRPLHWLGMVDLGKASENEKVTAFRITPLFNKLINNQPFNKTGDEELPIKISTELVFTFPLLASRMLRYQIARFCEIRSITTEATSYEITPLSLKIAQKAGLKPSQLIQLLEKQIKAPLPKSLLLMAENWEKHGLAANIESAILLRALSPEIVQLLQQDPRTAKFILETITPTIAVIHPGGSKVIKELLVEQGLLIDINMDQ